MTGVQTCALPICFKLNGSLLRAGIVDELLVYLAPTLLGPAQGMARLPELQSLNGQVRFKFHQVQPVGDDLRLLLRPVPEASAS